MKSVFAAERTFKHNCNTSSSKQQYSFGRDKRFNNRFIKTQFSDRFY